MSARSIHNHGVTSSFVRRVTAPGLAIAVLLSGTGLRAQAQASAPGATVSSAATDPYARYSPSECAQAPRQEARFLRDKAADTLRQNPLGNRLDASTIAAVRQCVARYTVSGVPPRELLGLGTTYLAAELDVQADSAFQRLLQLNAGAAPTTRAWTLYQIVRRYMKATPSRIARAESYLPALHALGAEAAAEQLLAHMAIAERAKEMDSLPLLETHATAAIAASQQLQGDSAKMYAYYTAMAYGARIELQMRRNQFDTARRTFQEITNIVGRVRPKADVVLWSYTRWIDLIGMPAKPIQATMWLNTGTSPDTVTPMKGRPMLLVFFRSDCDGYRGADYCYASYTMLRRLMQAHPNIPVTFVTHSEGTFNKELKSTDAEAKLLADYLLNVVRIRAPIAFRETPFSSRSDGYVLPGADPNMAAYNMSSLQTPTVVLIDAAGLIQRWAELWTGNEMMLDRAMGAVGGEKQ